MNSPDHDLATHYEEALHKIRALVHGACALHERDDANSVAHLLDLALREIDQAITIAEASETRGLTI